MINYTHITAHTIILYTTHITHKISIYFYVVVLLFFYPQFFYYFLMSTNRRSRRICPTYKNGICKNPNCPDPHPMDYCYYMYAGLEQDIHPIELRLAVMNDSTMTQEADKIWLSNYELYHRRSSYKWMRGYELPMEDICDPFDVGRMRREVDNFWKEMYDSKDSYVLGRGQQDTNRFGREDNNNNRFGRDFNRFGDSTNRGFDNRSGGFDNRGGGFDNRGGGFDNRGGGFRGGEFRESNRPYRDNNNRGGGFSNNRGGGFNDNRGSGGFDNRGSGGFDNRGAGYNKNRNYHNDNRSHQNGTRNYQDGTRNYQNDTRNYRNDTRNYNDDGFINRRNHPSNNSRDNNGSSPEYDEFNVPYK